MEANDSSEREMDLRPDGGGAGSDYGGGDGSGERRAKRRMKTPAQIEVLERTYQETKHPGESLRQELSAQLDLTDRQLQMWFCHRRLKEKKMTANSDSAASSVPKKAKKEDNSPPTICRPQSPPDMVIADVADPENEPFSGSRLGLSSYGHQHKRRGVAVARIRHVSSSCEPPRHLDAESRALMHVEAQLGGPVREDGPALGVEFNPLPPGAFGAPIDDSGTPLRQARQVYGHSSYGLDAKPTKLTGRSLHEYQFLPDGQQASSPDGPKTRSPAVSKRSYMHGEEEHNQVPNLVHRSHNDILGYRLASAADEFDGISQEATHPGTPVEHPFISRSNMGLDAAVMPSEQNAFRKKNVVRADRKQKIEDATMEKEVHILEKRIKAEQDKQDMCRQKKEEQIRKREQQKEEERMLREKQREEEKYQREQRREMERMEKLRVKESIRAEKLRQKEELRKEKEAAKQKAANDRAAARRIAKEASELIEDGRLELMEMAASSKGLSSILLLDSDSLQNLDSFRDMMSVFPPKIVQLRKPFSAQPWIDSEENVGNLLMLWQFLITFADLLGLWPFTLDELVQSLHDYDARLLGEIHIALLKSIIKDIEDVARKPATFPGANQYSAAITAGGHPQIVEGAYAWGFNIQSWQCHLSPLTWPEILRQFALSAGFGPKLRKENFEPPHMPDDNQGDDVVAVVSDLRSGVAAENAFALMQEKGYLNARRPRHRLTPGTVKFAAFHVLSVEGAKGLNILEIADRIQKSGLRDLTTSKTPEASISAALSRDTKLFERVAPSTYCVRSSYRKDPADAEAILTDAREKVQVFKSGFVDEVEAVDVEKDDDSEADTAEVLDFEDVDAELALKSVENSYEVKRSEEGFVVCHSSTGPSLMQPEEFSELNEVADAEQSKDIGSHVNGAISDQEGNEISDEDIDETSCCETWVQGFADGDYSTLSVEERLNALVALVGIAMEGNTVRFAVEERLEAANALRKQMLAEAHLDKRRLKEEHPSKSLGPDGKEQKPNVALENKVVKNDSSAGTDNLTGQQSTNAAGERSRVQMKLDIARKAEEVYMQRWLPLGMDRRRNRYWQFCVSASCADPGSGKVFVELHGGGWGLIDSEEDFDALVSSLDVRGVRESQLHTMLKRKEALFKATVGRKHTTDVKTELCRNSNACILDSYAPQTSSSYDVELKNVLKRYNDFEGWMWKEECLLPSFSSVKKYGRKRCSQLLDICNSCRDIYGFEDEHCPACHKTFPAPIEESFSKHVSQCEDMLNFGPSCAMSRLNSLSPVRIRLLKSQMALVEASIPSEALRSSWTDEVRKSFGANLLMASSAHELLQLLTFLEGSIKEDFLSSDFQPAKCDATFSCDLEAVHVLPWIPHTTAAVALRLMELEFTIFHMLHLKDQPANDTEAAVSNNNFQGSELHSKGGRKRKFCSQPNPRASSSKGAGRSQRRAPGGSRSETSRRAVSPAKKKPEPVGTGWKSLTAHGQERQKNKAAVEDEEGCNCKESALKPESAGNTSSERSMQDSDEGEAYAYDDYEEAGGASRVATGENESESEDEENPEKKGTGEENEDNCEQDFDVERYLNADSDEGGDRSSAEDDEASPGSDSSDSSD